MTGPGQDETGAVPERRGVQDGAADDQGRVLRPAAVEAKQIAPADQPLLELCT